MKAILAVLLMAAISASAFAGADDWLAATAAARELYTQMDFLQRSLSTIQGQPRGFYTQFDGIYNDLIYFQQQLKRKASREAVLLAFDKMDGKLHQLLKDLKNFEKWNAGLAMTATQVEAADHDLHFALLGTDNASSAAGLKRQVLALQSRRETLDNMVRYVFDGLGALKPWTEGLTAFRQSLDAFQQMQGGNAAPQDLKNQFAVMDRTWQRTVQRVKDLGPNQFVVVQSDAAQVDQALARLAGMLGISERRPTLVDPLAF